MRPRNRGTQHRKALAATPQISGHQPFRHHGTPMVYGPPVGNRWADDWSNNSYHWLHIRITQGTLTALKSGPRSNRIWGYDQHISEFESPPVDSNVQARLRILWKESFRTRTEERHSNIQRKLTKCKDKEKFLKRENVTGLAARIYLRCHKETHEILNSYIRRIGEINYY